MVPGDMKIFWVDQEKCTYIHPCFLFVLQIREVMDSALVFIVHN